MSKITSIRALRVLDNSQHTMPLKAWNYIKNNVEESTRSFQWEILGYTITSFVDGQAVENYYTGDPNHHSQHKEPVVLKSVAPVVSSVGVVEKATEPTKNDEGIISIMDLVEQGIPETTVTASGRRRGRPAQTKLQEVQG